MSWPLLYSKILHPLGASIHYTIISLQHGAYILNLLCTSQRPSQGLDDIIPTQISFHRLLADLDDDHEPVGLPGRNHMEEDKRTYKNVSEKASQRREDLLRDEVDRVKVDMGKYFPPRAL